MKKIYLVHPFRQHNFEQASELKNYFGNYVKLITSFYIPKIILRCIFIQKYRQKLSNRSIDNFSNKNYSSLTFLFFLFRIGLFNTDKFRNEFIKKAIKLISENSIIIGYDGNSVELFKHFKGKSTLILDMTIALENYSLIVNPEKYNKKVRINQDFLKSKYLSNKISEIKLADQIIVGSKFAFDSIVYFFPHFSKKIKILPYGFNPDIWQNQNKRNFYEDKLDIIFVGTASYRKGFHVILEMIKKNPYFFNHFNLKIFGNVDNEFLEELKTENRRIKVAGFLSSKELNNEMNISHLLILPSYLEGSSITIYQAMATGLPCIVTDHVGSIISDELDGIICNVGNEDDLMDKLNWAKDNRGQLARMSKDAEFKVKDFTWATYGNRLSLILEEFLNDNKLC